MFRRVKDVQSQLESMSYFTSLDGYLTSLHLINPSMEQTLLLKPKDRFLMGIPPVRASVEVRNPKFEIEFDLCLNLGLYFDISRR
jgi:hypothetical protein